MNKIYPKIIILGLIVIFGLEYYTHYDYKQAKEYEAQAVNEIEVAKERKELVDFTLKAMDIPPISRLSRAAKQAKALKLANVTMKYIPTQDARQQYISMLKIESNYNNNVKSSANAIGIGQILKSTFKAVSESDDCNIDVEDDDIYNEDMNLEIGACYYASLLKVNNQNPRLATLWYNGGGKTVEQFKKFGNINQESGSYALKTERVKELASK